MDTLHRGTGRLCNALGAGHRARRSILLGRSRFPREPGDERPLQRSLPRVPSAGG